MMAPDGCTRRAEWGAPSGEVSWARSAVSEDRFRIEGGAGGGGVPVEVGGLGEVGGTSVCEDEAEGVVRDRIRVGRRACAVEWTVGVRVGVESSRVGCGGGEWARLGWSGSVWLLSSRARDVRSYELMVVVCWLVGLRDLIVQVGVGLSARPDSIDA